MGKLIKSHQIASLAGDVDPDFLTKVARQFRRTIVNDMLIDDIRRAKVMGFVGMIMPGNPELEDYDQPLYDPMWECAADLEMPVYFHILTSKESDVRENV